MHLSRFPRIRLAHTPTPLEPLANLTRALGGPQLFVKRDDCTGLATGGNKTRKLEFLMGEALEAGADTVITEGAVQSNHCRQTAAAATKTGAQGARSSSNDGWPTQARSTRRRATCCSLSCSGPPSVTCPAGTDMTGALEEVADEIRTKGGKPYVIPGGGSNRVGALGYVGCAIELVHQANEAGIRIDHVVHATGSSGTQAGLLAGLEGMNTGIPVYGIGVRRPKEPQEQRVHALAEATAAYVGVSGGIARDRVVANCDYIGQGYGVPTEAMVEAVRLTARHEGLLLDPVYSGKAMAGLIDLIRRREVFSKGDNVVFIHTGGSVGLFGYREVFAPA